MYTRYTRTGRPSYVCSTLRSDYGLPVCQSAPAGEIEAWVAGEIRQVAASLLRQDSEKGNIKAKRLRAG